MEVSAQCIREGRWIKPAPFFLFVRYILSAAACPLRVIVRCHNCRGGLRRGRGRAFALGITVIGWRRNHFSTAFDMANNGTFWCLDPGTKKVFLHCSRQKTSTLVKAVGKIAHGSISWHNPARSLVDRVQQKRPTLLRSPLDLSPLHLSICRRVFVLRNMILEKPPRPSLDSGSKRKMENRGKRGGEELRHSGDLAPLTGLGKIFESMKYSCYILVLFRLQGSNFIWKQVGNFVTTIQIE